MATARAIWKGVIRFGDAAVPVKFYSAVNDRKVHFRLLHRTDKVPVQQRMVHPQSGDPVPSEDIRRGYAMEDGRIVLLDAEALQSLEPEPSRDIRVTRFVAPGRITHQWYDRPYYLGPDGSGPGYFALVEALSRERRLGVAVWTMRRKHYLGVVGVKDGFLTMVTLRHAEEVVEASELPRPRSRDLEPQEKRMAEQLVLALGADFEPAAFRETFRDRVLDLIDKKARGIQPLPPKRQPKRAPEPSLTESLKRSLEAAKKERRSA